MEFWHSLGTCRSTTSKRDHGRRHVVGMRAPAHSGFELALFAECSSGALQGYATDLYHQDQSFAAYITRETLLDQVSRRKGTWKHRLTTNFGSPVVLEVTVMLCVAWQPTYYSFCIRLAHIASSTLSPGHILQSAPKLPTGLDLGPDLGRLEKP